MDHVAILNKSWGLLPKVVDGSKTIESRWYLNRSVPWGKIVAGDTVYFKNSAEPVTVRATVAKVLRFEQLTPTKVQVLLNKYGKAIGIEYAQTKAYYQRFQSKQYCLLIFLKDVREIKPFEINKAGFGAMAAWLCVGDINKIKR